MKLLQIARGELEETRYFVLLSRDLGYVTPQTYECIGQNCDSVGRLINALASSLKRRLRQGESPVTNH
jgi:four helix bundle protein